MRTTINHIFLITTHYPSSYCNFFAQFWTCSCAILMSDWPIVKLRNNIIYDPFIFFLE